MHRGAVLPSSPRHQPALLLRSRRRSARLPGRRPAHGLGGTDRRRRRCAAVLLLVAVRLADRRERRGSPAGRCGRRRSPRPLIADRPRGPGLAPDIRTEESKGVRPDTAARRPRSGAPCSGSMHSSVPGEHDPVPRRDLGFGDLALGRRPDFARPVRYRRPVGALRRARRAAGSVLIIGAAGGNEIAAAVHFGAEQIDAVELNPETARLLRGATRTTPGNLTDPAGRPLRRRRRPELPGRERGGDTTSSGSSPRTAMPRPTPRRAGRSSCRRATSTRRRCWSRLSGTSPTTGMVVMQFGEKDYASPAQPHGAARRHRPRGLPRSGASAPSTDHVAVVVLDGGGVPVRRRRRR